MSYSQEIVGRSEEAMFVSKCVVSFSLVNA